MKRVFIDGICIDIVDLSELPNILEAKKLDNIPIQRVDDLRREFSEGFLFPGLLIGFRKSKTLENTLRYGYYLESATYGFRGVSIEFPTCENCGLQMQGCTVRVFDLYLDTLNAVEKLNEAKALPYLACPRCKSQLGRKYFALYSEGAEGLHIV